MFLMHDYCFFLPRIKTQISRINSMIDINQDLSTAHKSRIMETPFWYFKNKIKMNVNLLRKLLHQWDASSLRFKVWVKTLTFKHLDVCYALGLSIIEEPLPKSDDRDSHVKSLCERNENINVDSLHSNLLVHRYGNILFALSALYFSSCIFNIDRDLLIISVICS